MIALALLAAFARALVLLDRAESGRAHQRRRCERSWPTPHQLRTPVAALQATAERLLRDEPRAQARPIEAGVARDSGRLGHLIDDLLNLARLDARERPHGRSVDLADLASAAVAATRTTTRPHTSNWSPTVRSVTGDRDALISAVRNLLDNAFAVADTVVVDVTRNANGPTMSVTENGPGARSFTATDLRTVAAGLSCVWMWGCGSSAGRLSETVALINSSYLFDGAGPIT